MDKLKFSSLLCSQIFHDLAGSLSVIDNTLDLINPEESIASNTEEFNFISKASKQSVIQLKFLRLLFGRTTENLIFDDVFEVSNRYLVLRDIELIWTKENLPVENDAIFIKLILSFFYGSKVILPFGGKIKVIYKNKNNFEIEFKGKKIIDDEKILNLINANSIYQIPDTKFTPFVFACLLSNELELRFKKSLQTNSVTYKANKK
ncbi:MAG: hypothetical protein CMM49_07310 [Rhodospirillaceae bacterium]|nr:hypothetical protein [Rhodospirillaceae bacterium]|tara:strand:+ start:3843 stop:4457 length:615 start_codon:yes stop_codon:yes gene_type:complete